MNHSLQPDSLYLEKTGARAALRSGWFCANTGDDADYWIGTEFHARFEGFTVAELVGREVDIDVVLSQGDPRAVADPVRGSACGVCARPMRVHAVVRGVWPIRHVLACLKTLGTGTSRWLPWADLL